MPGFNMKKGKRGGGGKVSSSWNSLGLIGDQADAESISGTGGWVPSLAAAAGRGGGGFFGGKH